MTTTNQAIQTETIEKHYSVTELTNLGLGSRSKIDRLVRNGILTKIKIGRSTRFKASDIQAYLNSLQG
ncbi:helix-turn-helix transcriptional regulator [Rodentibacter haemolyticus]|uniref:Helix-turn-helix domain-containing protein n=1 Tax=Rodentibacter haemolyticus TaxID=2778911 RepID=A0ABX6UZD5_9PAST|nr:helix-turn-helix domain-containing protein [Rodentibacter haemolyticus]QPB42660.1 helix-turn-helix domain-containing protein [Rodentibacter haemolyticus]